MTKTTAPKHKQVRNKKLMLVRYGRMKKLGLFEHDQGDIPATPQRVVIKTDKGLELGTIAGNPCCYRGGNLKQSKDQINQYYRDSQIDFNAQVTGRMIRFATAEDISEERHFQGIARKEAVYCREVVEEMNLPMKIVDAEHILGGERIIFYFMSEGRVDFRELVKKLAHEYQTRIEMRQIGARDEAKLLGDLESCGQQCCCIRFLKALKPVNMRMAKLQKATLDPAKISGYCGRLKCCLRYEDETYTKLKKRLPKKNTRVKCSHGEGRVLNSQIITQLVLIETDTGTRVAVPLEELTIIPSPPQQKRKPEQKNDRGEDNRRSGRKPEQRSDNNEPEVKTNDTGTKAPGDNNQDETKEQ